MLYGYIYETTNLVNEKKYIGQSRAGASDCKRLAMHEDTQARPRSTF